MTGRPSVFTQEIADEICERLGRGESLRSITRGERDDFIPSETTVRRWLSGDEDWNESFRRQYAHARDVQADTIFDEILDIADEPATDGVEVQRNRLRVDARKWAASKLAPKKYGDKLELSGGTSNVNANVDLASLDPQEAVRMYQDLIGKT